jgi:hypothetical protein
VTGTGDFTDGSGADCSRPLLANVGKADLFCFEVELSSVDVSTLKEPVGGRLLYWKPLLEGLESTGVETPLELVEPEASWLRFAEMRARRDTDASLGSLFVLMERSRPSGRGGGGTFSEPGGAPEVGSSV